MDFNVGDRVFYAGKHASVQRFNHGEPHQWAYLFPIPEGLDPIEGSVGCMAQIAMTAPNMTDLKLGDTVVVFGLGVVGVLAAMMYQIRGAKVIGVDPVAHRCELAKKLGIQTVVGVAPDKQIDEIMRLTNGKGAEVTVDAAGHSAVVQTCIKTTALFGQVILLGTPRAPFQGNVTDAFLLTQVSYLKMYERNQQETRILTKLLRERSVTLKARPREHPVRMTSRACLTISMSTATNWVAPLQNATKRWLSS